MPADLTTYEPRPEDDRAESTQDEDAVYCGLCGYTIDDDDCTAVSRVKGRSVYWLHAECVS